MKDLDRYFTPRGPCAFCGDPDARHRLFDTILGAIDAGDTIDAVARWYHIPVEAVRAVLATRGPKETS